MKQEIKRRKPESLKDYVALAVTTFGVGYLPLMPGTYGSMVGVLIYLGIDKSYLILRNAGFGFMSGPPQAHVFAFLAFSLLIFFLISLWASGRAIAILGKSDPPEAVVDEILGQLVTLAFVPFGVAWPFLLAGFLLFRLFDIWKPYPIDDLQNLSGGLGVCADDIAAGVYAGIVLAVIYAISLSV